ncbi:UNVERIFIED_CONTAM: hypothetical protein RMT77_003174 [Armadillidium vulgare]
MGLVKFFVFILFGILLSFGYSGKVSLDSSGVIQLENQMKLYTYSVLATLDHLATNTFKLKLSPKAMKKLDFLQNVTTAGVSFSGLTDVPNYEDISKEALQRIEPELSDGSLFLLRALSSKQLAIPLTIKPTDETLNETMSLMIKLKDYWKIIDKVTTVEVQEFDPFRVEPNIKQILLSRTSNYSIAEGRQARNFLVPDLPLQVSQENLQYLLENVFVKPRDFETEDGNLEKSFIRHFITKSFEELNLLVFNHEFSVHENHYLYEMEVVGTNIVGVLPGERWGTADDVPLLIGAHYDTVFNTSGSIDNASGATAVLEVARLLTSSKCKFKNTIFFVAFDLEEIGIQGSFMFVKDFLLKIFFPTYRIKSFGGAFVLDCVANWDPESGAQEVPETWDEKVHGFKSRMNERSHTGDFIAVINRKDPDKHLAQKFAFYFENLNNPEFRLEMMPLNELQESRPNSSINMENFDFFRSDHYRFWYPSEETPSISLPALLLTDTAPYRGKMKQCYHEYCDNFETIKPNIKFLAKVIKATAWALADLAEGSCGPRGLFSIPELFDVVRVRNQIETGTSSDTNRPSITPEGILEILKYLGKIQKANSPKPVDEINLSNTNNTSLLMAPMHRFKIQSTTNNLKSGTTSHNSSFNKITIAIHGANSAFLIPLKVDYTKDFSNLSNKTLLPLHTHTTNTTLINNEINKHTEPIVGSTNTNEKELLSLHPFEDENAIASPSSPGKNLSDDLTGQVPENFGSYLNANSTNKTLVNNILSESFEQSTFSSPFTGNSFNNFTIQLSGNNSNDAEPNNTLNSFIQNEHSEYFNQSIILEEDSKSRLNSKFSKNFTTVTPSPAIELTTNEQTHQQILSEETSKPFYVRPVSNTTSNIETDLSSEEFQSLILNATKKDDDQKL